MRELIIQKLLENKSLARKITGLAPKSHSTFVNNASDDMLLYLYRAVIERDLLNAIKVDKE